MHSPFIILQSPRLVIEIAKPGTVYQGSRFDWTAFITQITLDGKHTFCAPEDRDATQGTGGIGLCNEFGIEKAIGYDEAAPGEAFPKLGIGLLKRPDEQAYNFFRPHEIAKRFPMRVEIQEDTARFYVEPWDCRGYAARLTKNIYVRENQLEIEYLLENTGSKGFATHEYCHNFISIDNTAIGPAYQLRFPYPIQIEDDRPNIGPIEIQNYKLGFGGTPDQSFYCRMAGFFPTGQAQWELTHLPSGVMIREFDDFAPSRVAVWGTTHVISSEVFIDFHIDPGQSQSWTRRYEFGS